MMLVKTHVGDGAWALFEAHEGLRFLGPHNVFEMAEDDHSHLPANVPRADHLHFSLIDPQQGKHFARWAVWRDAAGEGHLLVSDTPIFVCNERGDTVETLR